MLGKDLFLLTFDIRKRFLQDTKVHLLQPSVIMDFLKKKNQTTTKQQQKTQPEASLRDLLAYYFAVRQDQFYLLFKRSLSGFPLKIVMTKTKSSCFHLFVCLTIFT